MIRYTNFHVSQRHTSAAVIADLTERYPEGLISPGLIRMVGVRDGDARLDQVKAIFDRHGIVGVNQFEESGPNTYRYSRSVTYEPHDLEHADYFCFHTDYDGVETTCCDEDDDEFKVYATELKKRKHKHRLFLDNGWPNTLMVPDRVRQRLEEQDLIGLCFKPLQACNRKEKPVAWDEVEYGPYWWMTSDKLMPRLHPDTKEFDGHGRPWDFATSRTGVYLAEDKFPPDQLRYRASDMEAMDPFDIAVTCETFGMSKHTESRRVVVSPRMREVMHDMEKKIIWKPVYVDADA